MDWLRRSGRQQPAAEPDTEPDWPPPATEVREGAAPGVAALLDGISEDRSHSVLDLGPATDASLQVYSRFARWVRFVDLTGDSEWPNAADSARTVLAAVPSMPQRPYDLIFAWDVLDRVFPEERPHVMRWIADLVATDARLHAVVRSSAEAPPHPLRFALLGTDRVRFDVSSQKPLPQHRLLPAEVNTLLAPFRVIRAFTLKNGLREYVAHRSD